MIHRGAATCQVADHDELHQGNHGKPLHVWRVDYGAFNGSGKPLSQLTAHFQIEAEWPPCTDWTDLGEYPGPVRWVGSFETVQRPDGMRPGEQAGDKAYLLAIEGQQPRLSRWQLDFRFGEVMGDPVPAPAAQPEPDPPPVPRPICDFDSDNLDDWSNCWYKLASPADCYAWHPLDDFYHYPDWSGGCLDSRANGPGELVVMTTDPFDGRDIEVRHKGTFRNGKKHGHWTEAYGRTFFSEGPFIDGSKHGRWKSIWPQDRDLSDECRLEHWERGERIRTIWRPNR